MHIFAINKCILLSIYFLVFHTISDADAAAASTATVVVAILIFQSFLIIDRVNLSFCSTAPFSAITASVERVATLCFCLLAGGHLGSVAVIIICKRLLDKLNKLPNLLAPSKLDKNYHNHKQISVNLTNC